MKHISWIVPFIFFIFGYGLLYKTYQTESIELPILTGLSLSDAVKITGSLGLNMRIIREEEYDELPEGTIIQQHPAPHTLVKANQAIFVTTSRHKKHAIVPSCIGKTKEEIEKIVAPLDIKTKYYELHSSYPTKTCFTQYPTAHAIAHDDTIIIYLSSAMPKPIIIPDFKEKTVSEAQDIIAGHPISCEYTHHQKTCLSVPDHMRIIDQRPLPGSIVSCSATKPLVIHLHVE